MFKALKTSISLTVCVLLTACATPQEKAISAYCDSQGLAKFPPVMMAVTEQYQQQVGSRKVGERQVCDKEEETQNRKRGEITQTTRVCTTTDILEPLYEIRTRPGYLDTQKIPRDAFRKVCELDALRAGMYSDVK